MAANDKKPAADPVDAIRHKDKRVNIPTEELRDFVADEEKSPRIVLYPRDPSLDPQLVWRGKDEQDAQDLAVPAVPIYIQEKILPQAIVENVRAEAEKGVPRQAALFDDFNGIGFEETVDFYRHEQNWSNRMILGDSLLVMTSLAEKEGLKGKVQMIYLDPPYGIKFGSNWQVSTRKRDVKDGKVDDLTRQPEQIRAFRDTWQLGIHSYLSYLRDRLVVARELLTESGSIFVQIGDENVHLVRCLLDEVFGSENFVSTIAFYKTSSQSTDRIPSVADYLLLYARDAKQQKFRRLLRPKVPGERGARQYDWLISADMHSLRRMTDTELGGVAPIPAGWKPCTLGPTTSQGRQDGRSVPYTFRGQVFVPSPDRHWSWDPAPGGDMDKLAMLGRLWASGRSLRAILLAEDNPTTECDNIWTDTGTGSFTQEQLFVVQTAEKVIQRCILMTTDPGDLVLDPTCGSGTTAYVAEQWGRRWITIDTSRVALALARTRLMAARYPYYLLADSPQGMVKEAEITGQVPPTPIPRTENDVKKGFVYRRVPHVTLKSIANNEEIDAIHAGWQERLEPIRTQLNRLLRRAWEEWQIPREADESWPDEAKELLDQWWEMRRERQREIDASIARHADTELLYDRPYEDSKRIRVAGPFTVESLSPHRVLSADEERPASEGAAADLSGAGQFVTMILENLRKAGVQNTRRNERLKFDRLEPYAGTWVNAAGEYTDASGIVRRVAISIGPEHGTVGPEQVKEAAKEALRGVGFDLLVVCGFAFDAHANETAREFSPDPWGTGHGFVAEETRRYGKLPVLLARINPDLAMGDCLLKNTGAGNLFTVFGEPDLELRTLPDGRLAVQIRGLDIYDPTTGEIRACSADEIACWFVDTEYNGESFFVRQAYFTGAGDPYDKLKRALRVEIDEAAWSALYSTVSLPFDAPKSGKIAVKVINHYGDEVLKVFSV